MKRAPGLLLCALFLLPGIVSAQADSDVWESPLILDAQQALERRDVTPALKWVHKPSEPAVRRAFRQTLRDRIVDPMQKETQTTGFCQTLIRLHCQSHGIRRPAVYSSDTRSPALSEADRALERGICDDLVYLLTGSVNDGIKKRFERVLELERHKDDSVAAGRAYVQAYAGFRQYVRILYETASRRTPSSAVDTRSR